MDLLYFICAKLVGVENLKASFMDETSFNRVERCVSNYCSLAFVRVM